MSTLTYVYADSTAVLGPLATYAEPHTYDLCELHAERLTVPRGWEVLRLTLPGSAPQPSVDDLLTLADAARGSAQDAPGEQPAPGARDARTPAEGTAGPSAPRRGHLRILPGP